MGQVPESAAEAGGGAEADAPEVGAPKAGTPEAGAPEAGAPEVGAPETGATEVTAAGIARLAGVGRAAVSNWRRRHPDFPKPVGGTETSPSFALADVERWLREQGKLAEVPLRERVWQQIAGHPAGAVNALVHAGCALLLVRDRSAAWPSLAELPDRRLVDLLPLALEETLTERLGPERAVRTPTSSALSGSVALLRGPPNWRRRRGSGRPSSSCSAGTSTPTRASTP